MAALTGSVRPVRGVFDAVLFDRDGTLIRDVPYNGDPDLVEPMPGAVEALRELRGRGLALGVVSNQSGVGRGLISADQLAAVNRRVDQLLGPFDTWQSCVHRPEDRCACRKPAPGMIQAGAAAIGVPAHRCVVVGDIGTDMQAALAAGASGVLVPTQQTLPGEIAAAPAVAENLLGAVEWLLYRQTLGAPQVDPASPGRHVLVVRPDSIGDTLLTGPAIRAVAATAGRVTLWCGRRGAAAGRLLPGVDDILEWTAPWIDAEPDRVDASAVAALVDTVRGLHVDEAIIFTSYHQSPLPTALLLRLAGLARISAISVDYPGSLLDVRHHVDDGLPEPERALSLAAAAGYLLPDGDDGRLAVNVPTATERDGRVVLHAGSNAPARSIPADLARLLVLRLRADGRPVVLTGEPGDRPPADGGVTDLRGRTDLAELAALLAGSACLVTGNSGPAHLAAAVGTPVVSLYAPTVPFGRWQPYRVPVVRIGDPLAPCRDSRVSVCRTPTRHCLSTVDPAIVTEAVARLIGERR